MDKMNKRIIILLLLICNISILFSQVEKVKKPKLVIGIVVDQMRFDYLYKYENKYGNGGFKRMLREGYNFKNAHVNYAPTVTAAGHASIYTGTTPALHGIIGNSWFDRYKNDIVGNVDDPTETIIGSTEVNDIGVSPKKMLTSTISDELRVGTNFKSKVISISLKDRGAILPGGHTANAAYWHDYQTSPGYFVSSSYYMQTLPKWVSVFNSLEKSNAYLNTIWETLYPIESYTESAADANNFEHTIGGKRLPTFPYDLASMRKRYKKKYTEYQLLWATPGGNSLLTDFALAAIKNEKLGSDESTDLLNISFSVPDAAGHTYGPQSVEIEDIYLRLDKNIETLLNSLDSNIGKDNYVVFLTADHAAIQVASYLKEHKLPTGIARIKQYRDTLNMHLTSKYGKKSWIQYFEGDQLYLNRAAISDRKLVLKDVQQEVADFLINLKGINSALTSHHLLVNNYDNGLRQVVQKGHHPKRSGDVVLVFDPGIIQNSDSTVDVNAIKGTTHGSVYAYDTHIPLLWMGSGIHKGSSVRKVGITDIAPSLAMILNLQLPSGSTGNPLQEIFINKNE